MSTAAPAPAEATPSVSSPYLNSLLAGLASSAIGAGVASMATRRRANETDEEYQSRLNMNRITGLIGGGALGAAIPSIYSRLPQSESAWSKWKQAPFSETAKVVGDAATKLLGGVAPASGAGIGAVTGGVLADKGFNTSVESAKADLAAATDRHAKAVTEANKILAKTQTVTPEMQNITDTDKADTASHQAKIDAMTSKPGGEFKFSPRGRAVAGGVAKGTAWGQIAGMAGNEALSRLGF